DCVTPERKTKLTIAENKELLPLSGRDLSQKGQQVVGNTLRVFTHDAAGVGARRVEVTQQGSVPLLGLISLSGLGEVVALRVDEVRDGRLNNELGVSVGVRGAQGALLGDGDHVREARRVTIDSGRAGEDNVGDIVALHSAEQVDRAVDVDMVVVERPLAGLADSLADLRSAPKTQTHSPRIRL
ncbi:hypothetical protein T310_10320, partial [Rasamsonia emersonii CBS 393.64]